MFDEIHQSDCIYDFHVNADDEWVVEEVEDPAKREEFANAGPYGGVKGWRLLLRLRPEEASDEKLDAPPARLDKGGEVIDTEWLVRFNKVPKGAKLPYKGEVLVEKVQQPAGDAADMTALTLRARVPRLKGQKGGPADGVATWVHAKLSDVSLLTSYNADQEKKGAALFKAITDAQRTRAEQTTTMKKALEKGAYSNQFMMRLISLLESTDADRQLAFDVMATFTHSFPNNVHSLFDFGDMNNAYGEYTAAAQYYTRVLGLVRHPKAHSNRVYALAKTGEYELAIRAGQEALGDAEKILARPKGAKKPLLWALEDGKSERVVATKSTAEISKQLVSYAVLARKPELALEFLKVYEDVEESSDKAPTTEQEQRMVGWKAAALDLAGDHEEATEAWAEAVREFDWNPVTGEIVSASLAFPTQIRRSGAPAAVLEEEVKTAPKAEKTPTPATPQADTTPPAPDLAAELKKLKLSALLKKARKVGVDPDAIDAALDEDSPKGALVEMIVKLTPAPTKTTKPAETVTAKPADASTGTWLEQHKLTEHKQIFAKLGVDGVADFELVEVADLVDEGMSRLKAKRLHGRLQAIATGEESASATEEQATVTEAASDASDASTAENGGWGAGNVEPTPCNIDRVDFNVLGQDEFMAQYVHASKPVLLTGLTQGWSAFKDWTRDNFLQEFGNDVVRDPRTLELNSHDPNDRNYVLLSLAIPPSLSLSHTESAPAHAYINSDRYTERDRPSH